jgi:hypothetical protein
MKILNKIVLIVISGLFPVIISAQTNPLDGLIKKYADQPGFYFLDMKTNLFNSGNEVNATPSTGKIMSVKILAYEEGASAQYKALDIYDQFNSSIDAGTYKGLVEIKSSGDKVDMMVKKEGDKLSEVIIIIREKNEATFIAASGSFDLKDIAKFSGMKNCRGLETLEKLCKD